ncbi:MAG: ribosome silencing factor [Planctomycetota bacterium]
MEHEELVRRAIGIAVEKKARDIEVLDVSERLQIAEHFLLVSVDNRRQAQALCAALDAEFKKAGVPKSRIEGQAEGWWILLDFDSLVVHIFQSEAREYYGLDKLWADARNETGRFLEMPAPPGRGVAGGGI